MNATFNLSGTFVVMGVLNSYSLAWQIAERLRRSGADVIVTCQSLDLLPNVKKLGEKVGIRSIFVCDMEKSEDMDAFFAELANHAPIAGFVHGAAYSDPKELTGRLVDMSRDNFVRTMVVSCYTFLDCCRRVEPLMENGGKILTLTFGASLASCDNYNGMGLAKAALEAAVRAAARDFGGREIAVNALSPTTMRTAAARSVKDPYPLAYTWIATSLFGRITKPEEVAAWGAFLLSPLSDGMTGEVVYIDCGKRSSGMPPKRHAHLVAEMNGKYNPSSATTSAAATTGE
ncbi:SDR family oxidoreductase [Candidatus Parcubacteria bacterium]|nr:MAG: SDR family oxidoreductase [Candidatus Parcubacteria bacterium]